MPAPPLFDMSKVDPDRIVVDAEGIRAVNPQRFEFAQLDAVCYLDRELNEIAGVRDLRADEFWVRGHVPDRPLFPGVLMMETAAQLVSYYVMSETPEGGFMGFGGIDQVKFRGGVEPGQRIIMLGKTVEKRRRRVIGATQAYVDGKMVYEGVITGMWL